MLFEILDKLFFVVIETDFPDLLFQLSGSTFFSALSEISDIFYHFNKRGIQFGNYLFASALAMNNGSNFESQGFNNKA